MNPNLTQIHDYKKMSQKDHETLWNNWHQETDLKTLQSSGASVHNRACYELHRRRVLQNCNLDLLQRIDFLQIESKHWNNMHRAHMQHHRENLKSIYALGVKDNGEPINNEVKQLLQIIKNSEEEYKQIFKNVVEEYRKELERHGFQDHHFHWITFETEAEKKEQMTKDKKYMKK